MENPFAEAFDIGYVFRSGSLPDPDKWDLYDQSYRHRVAHRFISNQGYPDYHDYGKRKLGGTDYGN